LRRASQVAFLQALAAETDRDDCRRHL